MPDPSNAAVERARLLRRQATDAERLLWRHLRNRGVAKAKFRRQVPIAGITVDFADIEHRIAVEVDGGQHAKRNRQDQVRDTLLRDRGFLVLRFWNNEVLANIEGVTRRIAEAVERREGPSPSQT